MKYTNIKKLLIKFMGGGLVNFPTRFLRWVKIDGDADGDDGGGGDSESSNVFFSPVATQPTHIAVKGDDDTFSIIEIKDFTLSNGGDSEGKILIYSKDDLINIGINEDDLNNLEIVSIDEMFEDVTGDKGYAGQNLGTIINENYIVGFFYYNDDGCTISRVVRENNMISVIYRLGDNLYAFNAIQLMI